MVQVALEQFQPGGQRILQDELAAAFLPTPIRLLMNLFRFRLLRRLLFTLIERKVPGVRGGILCRKRYLDEKLLAAVSSGIKQIVNLGAGMDTRIYRLPVQGGVHAFELDLPENIAYKQNRLVQFLGQVPSHVTLIPIDFDQQEIGEALRAQDYREDQPSFFVWEGVTQYIPEAAVRKVFEFLAQAADGSQIVFTYIRQDFINGAQLYGMEAMYQATVTKHFWVFGLHPEQVGVFLREYGWKELEQVGDQEYQTRYLQPLERVLPAMEIERAVFAEKVPGRVRNHPPN
jgi:methyltransferase (TIGR00027 family)